MAEISTLLERRFGDADLVEVIGFLESSCGGSHPVLIPFPVRSARIGCDLQFQFYGPAECPQQFTLLFPSWLGEARIELLEITGVGPGKTKDLLKLNSAAAVRECSTHIVKSEGSAFYSHPRDENPAGIQFLVHENGKQAYYHQAVRVRVKVAWPEMIYGPEAEKALISHLWRKEEELRASTEETAHLREIVKRAEGKLADRTAELELLKSSKAWRVAELLRKVFFGWRRTQDEARNLSAIEQLAQKRVPPTECFSQINESGKIPNPEKGIPGVCSEPLQVSPPEHFSAFPEQFVVAVDSDHQTCRTEPP